MQYVKKGKLRKYLNKNEELLLDGAHSNTSGKNLFNYLKTIKLPIYCVWGMQKNKVPDQFLKEFKGIFKKIITVKIPNEPNSCSAKQLMSIANNQNYNVEVINYRNKQHFINEMRSMFIKKNVQLILFNIIKIFM